MSKSELLPVEQEVQSRLHTHFGDKIPKFVITVSGGPDSMALLYIFHKLDIEALVVHINYGKRGKESDKDAELVEQMAFQWGFDCQSIKVDPKEAEGQNFQQWARRVRYDVFRSLADEYDVAGIALAHHQDDQVETVLQKLFRGAGLESWSAMEVWDGELFRPLLHTSKKEIDDYCEQRAIPYRIDQSNLESKFARNFLRNEWLESLEVHFPGWKKNILRIPEQSEIFSEALGWIAGQIIDEEDRINRQQFLELGGPLAKALVLHKLKKVEPAINVGSDALEQLEKLKELQTGSSIQLTDKYSILRDREWFKIVFDEQESSSKIIRLTLDDLSRKPFSVDGLHFQIDTYADPDFGHCLYLDVAKLSWPVTLRKWEKGDSFQPLGMEGRQNVSDHLTNRKISAAHKSKALVLETFEETICAVIFPPIENRVPPGSISELSKCDDSTTRSLIIKRS